MVVVFICLVYSLIYFGCSENSCWIHVIYFSVICGLLYCRWGNYIIARVSTMTKMIRLEKNIKDCQAKTKQAVDIDLWILNIDALAICLRINKTDSLVMEFIWRTLSSFEWIWCAFATKSCLRRDYCQYEKKKNSICGYMLDVYFTGK